MDERFDVPLYTVGEAARHLGMNAETLRKWARKEHLLWTVSTERRNDPSLPFIAMAEAQFYRGLREAGLSMQAITQGMTVVRRELGRDMLRKGALAHDGRDILLNLAAGSHAPEWTRAKDGQGGIPGVIEHGLRPITFGKDGLPERVRLTAYEGADVIIDPRFVFGQPMEASSGVRAEDIVSMFRAGDSIAVVAEEFGVDERIVESIVRVHLSQAA